MDFKDIKNLARQFRAKWRQDRVQELGAALSFYSIFSMIPVLIILIGIGSLVFDEESVRQSLKDQAGSFVDQDALNWLDKMVDEWQKVSSRTVGIPIGILLVAFGATRMFNHLQNSLNIIFGNLRKK